MEIKKIVVVGSESSGKSTISEALAKALNTVWVPEYAREYLTELGRPYTEEDHLIMARKQLQSEDELAARANKYLVCDTDLYVIKVWGEDKYGRCHPWILEQIAKRKYDMYLLTDIDIPWEDDPLREHNLPEERRHFFNIYHDLVLNTGLPWALLSGSQEERLNTALKAIAAQFGK
ncbi:MAG: ATP-binding protein [Bacteroidetes bacterium]|nr:ATP-binding protein [Bacteroidota bacterium]